MINVCGGGGSQEMVKKKSQKSIFIKFLKLSQDVVVCFGTGLGMFLRPYKGLGPTYELDEKNGKNRGEIDILGGVSNIWGRNVNFFPIFAVFLIEFVSWPQTFIGA